MAKHHSVSLAANWTAFAHFAVSVSANAPKPAAVSYRAATPIE
jgi:hypothetical protein